MLRFLMVIILCLLPAVARSAPQYSYPTKTTPVAGDKVLIVDSQDSWRTKNVLFSTFVRAVVASGTSTLGTSAIASGTCASVVTTSATGTATTNVINWGFNGDPTGVTGYTPSANGMLTIIAYPSINNVNYKVCNLTVASITPGAITLNWRVQ